MKKMRVLFTSLALFALGLVGCNKNNNQYGPDWSSNNKKVESVELSTEYEQCEIGDSFQIEATIKFYNDEEVEVFKEWRSSRKNVATVSQEGFVEVVGTGTTYITFRAGYQIAKCTVYVPDQEPPTPPVPPVDPDALTISLSVTSRTLQVGGTFNLTATPSKAADVTFSVSNDSKLRINSQTTSACVVEALADGSADVIAQVLGENDTVLAEARCAVTITSEEDPGDKEYTIYFYIDYNNVDPKDNTKLLAKFDWYYDRPFSESGKVPTVTNDMALDPAFPYFIGWSTHPIIDTKENLWDINRDTVADLPMVSYTVILYGQWMDVPVLPAQEANQI